MNKEPRCLPPEREDLVVALTSLLIADPSDVGAVTYLFKLIDDKRISADLAYLLYTEAVARAYFADDKDKGLCL